MQRRPIQTKVYYQLFYSVRKKRLTNLKKQQLQKSLSQVCISWIQLALMNVFYIMDVTCFDEWFLFLVMTGRRSFLYKLVVTEGGYL